MHDERSENAGCERSSREAEQEDFVFWSVVCRNELVGIKDIVVESLASSTYGIMTPPVNQR